MSLHKTLFFLVIIFLFINLIILDINKIQNTGTINTIKYSNNKITITLKDNPNNYILFTNRIMDIKQNDKIKIIGQKSTYRNQPQIIVNKLIKIIPQPI